MNNRLIPYQEGSKWGYKNQKGQVVVRPQFDEVGDFSNGLAQVRVGNQVSYIDQSGQMITHSGVANHEIINDILGQIQDKHHIKSIHKIESVNIEQEDNQKEKIYENLIRVKIADKYGYSDPTGKLVVPAKFNQAWHFSEGLALVQIGYKWGYINTTGRLVIQFQFDWAESFEQGQARVRLANKYGYINQTGKVVIPIKFDCLEKFSEGLALIKMENKWGYINHSGELVIQCKFDRATSFFAGKASVFIGRNKRLIDKTGKFID
ncbi:WG repeat-containing protein [Anabaena azotica]|uniref:WG repeat-containing protein n=1 Tax=Anabaena azotica FACHB-119 TaxID=947527 RepID=A0ABR8D7H5_9NOST|nr:WG repeat-containing protein [Anabaena azotica]MBD2502280.1 WG repeat-containing protein [Anabaena azotica FACHB-119]